MEDYIKLLDLSNEFDLADLKKAYRQKVLQYHPDKASNEAERVGYEALMKKLNEANEYLKEYLENNNGRFSKSEYYNSNNSSDNTEDETYYDDNTTDDNTDSDEDNSEESWTQQNIIHSTTAYLNRIYKGTITGNLYLYSNALHFESDEYSDKQLSKTMYFKDIEKIEKITFPCSLRITYKDNTFDRIVVYYRQVWVKKLYTTLIQNNYELAHTSPAFDNMNRQYNVSSNPEAELEYFLDIPQWLQNLGVGEIYKCCCEIQRGNLMILFDTIKWFLKSFFKIIYRVLIQPFLITILSMVMESICRDYSGDELGNFGAIVMLVAMIYSLIPEKILKQPVRRIVFIFILLTIFIIYTPK